jgi:hypothetical protein
MVCRNGNTGGSPRRRHDEDARIVNQVQFGRSSGAVPGGVDYHGDVVLDRDG